MIFPPAFEIAAFVIGLLFGSFLNVCIVRLPRHESLWHPRSHCLKCGKTIRWYDNVPVLSWVLLRGRCRDCGERISWLYPVVELAIALWFALCAWLTKNLVLGMASLGAWDARINAASRFVPASFVSNLANIRVIEIAEISVLGFLLIGLLVMDWRTHTLPDAFTLPGIAIGFVLTCVQAAFLAPGELDVHFDPQRGARLRSPGSFAARGDVFMTGTERVVLERLAAIVAAACLLLLIRFLYKKLRGREGLGLGDAKLLAMIAAFLGFWPAMLALFLGVVLCSAYALTLLVRGRASATTRLPLGTFLCIGGLISALAGAPLIAWYTSLL